MKKALVFLLFVCCASLSALDCETWAAAGLGSRNDESTFKGRGFILGEIEVEGEEIDIISGPDFSYCAAAIAPPLYHK